MKHQKQRNVHCMTFSENKSEFKMRELIERGIRGDSGGDSFWLRLSLWSMEEMEIAER